MMVERDRPQASEAERHSVASDADPLVAHADEIVLVLARTVEVRDPATEGHSQRIAAYAWAMGTAVGVPHHDLLTLQRAALVHDVGKVAVPDAILHKTGRLTPEETAVMQRHPVVGEQLCAGFASLRPVRAIVRHHHERLDGSGYPDGLSGDAVPYLAQILGVVDVFDALTTARPYKPAHTFADALDLLRDEAARGLQNPALVETLASLHAAGTLARALAAIPAAAASHARHTGPRPVAEV